MAQLPTDLKFLRHPDYDEAAMVTNEQELFAYVEKRALGPVNLVIRSLTPASDMRYRAGNPERQEPGFYQPDFG